MSGDRELADLVAVAMPLYGHAALALEAIESVLASNSENQANGEHDSPNT